MNLSYTSIEDKLARVEVSGDVSQPNFLPQEEPLEKLLGTECFTTKVLLDLHGVEAIDSSGISWLLSCQRKFRARGGLLVLHSLSPFVRDVLKVLNMHLVFSIAEDERAALGLAQGSPS